MAQKPKLNPIQLTNSVIKTLSPRLREVITKRFGLDNSEPKTLEAIGRSFNVTRERVRQIETDAFSHLEQNRALSELNPLFEVLDSHFQNFGNLRQETQLLSEDLKNLFGASSVATKNAVKFALSLNEKFNRETESEEFHAFWHNDASAKSELQKVINGLLGFLKQRNEVVSFSDLLNQAKLSEQVLKSYLAVSKLVIANNFNEYGLSNWSQINLRGVKDKAYLVMKKFGKPLHFREVAEQINKTKFDSRRAYPQTVHNELIKDSRFILVGRGTYALKEWGYQAGTVKDVIQNVLKQKGSLNKNELLSEVLKQRQVKTNTILLNLQDRSRFAKKDDGEYILKA